MRGVFDLDQLVKKSQEIKLQMAESSFWDNSEKAQAVIEENNNLAIWIEPLVSAKNRFEAAQSMLPDAQEIADQELLEELYRELGEVEQEVEQIELRRMLSGELDKNACYLEINAGAGGTEACDWVSMLSRMYQRWAAKKQWKVELIDFVDGDVAGLKSIVLKIQGSFAYGYCKAEKGVHRLVRISPFDSNAKRHTSFASIDVTPEIADDIEVIIQPDEIRIDTYRASGAGGQHVNKTDSAVRITHLPTGIVVSCQNERSQHQNKENCFKQLRAKLYNKQLEERQQSLKTAAGEKKEIAWGSQIRNYTFQPYTLVKDTRTKHESGNVEAVMDGDLDPFVHAYLKQFGS